MTQIFIFKQENRENWGWITNGLSDYMMAVQSNCKKDFEVEIREVKKKRSGQQLKAYWVIIKSVADWMNEKGNCFTSEEVSDWFKIQSGHCIKINNQIIPKSIANKSSCTREQMETLINTILVFGAENLIPDCYVEDRELQELLTFYK